jgi:hypothetical protein
MLNITAVFPFLLITVFNSLIFTLIIPIAKSLVKASCCRLLKSGGNVAIEVSGVICMLAWPSLSRLIIFIVFVAFRVAGQGMHLAANSIDNLLGQRGLGTGDIYKLTYFYDEVLSHYLWHIGIVGLSGLLIYRQRKRLSQQS